LKDLIEKTLRIDPNERISSQDLIKHPFFNNEMFDEYFE
jgi:serine/threonine protein kinase